MQEGNAGFWGKNGYDVEKFRLPSAASKPDSLERKKQPSDCFSWAEKEGFELRVRPSKNIVKTRRFRASSLSPEQICATFYPLTSWFSK